MSTVVEPRRGRHAKDPERGQRGGARPSDPVEGKASRIADWRSSWRIALKMARRDLRRHKGRSAVIALMVGIPILILSLLASFGSGLIMPAQTDPTRLMGTAAAIVSGPDSYHLLQTGSDWNYGPLHADVPGAPGETTPVDATPIPGFAPEGTAADNAGSIGALVAGTATPVAEPSVRVEVDDRRVLMRTLALDGSRTDFGDKVQLLSGRWPAGPHEALVTEPGIRNGLPSSGTFEVVTAEGTSAISVVGTGTGLMTWGMVPHLISAEPVGGGTDETGTQQWLVSGTDMPFSTVHELGSYGLQILSAELIIDPVPRDQLPPEVQQGIGYSDSGTGTAMAIVAAAVVLALIIGLMVAPAFAVGAGRQRHTLALAASNGATTRQLRRTVLAQALVLGALAAVVGALIGVGIAAVMAWRTAATATDLYLPIIDVPWPAIVGFIAIAVMASVTAALLPARRLGRLDIMGVIKGQNVSPPPSRILPILGLVLIVVGGAAVLLGARRFDQGDFYVTGGAIPLVVGALLLVPMALALTGRLSAGLPVPLRMATRDAARQRTRSVPTVAAVMGGVAALTIGLISGASDNKENLATYLPRTVMGQGVLYAYDVVDAEPALGVVREILPGAEIAPMMIVAQPMGPVSGEQPFAIVTSSACTAEKAMYDKEWWDAQGAAFEAAADQNAFVFGDPPCPVVGGPTAWGSLVALPAAEIISRFNLSDAQAAQVRSGAVVALETTRLRGSSATAWSGTYVFDESTGNPQDIVVTGERPLDLISVSEDARRAGQMPADVAAVVPLEVAEDAAWPMDAEGTGVNYLVTPPAGGEITTEDEKLITERIDNAGFSVERGFVDELTKFLAIVVAGVAFILLVIILTSTALSMAEQRRDDSTLAAVGATRGTRRAMAAAQGFTAGAIGAVLGLIVGILPGIAFTYPLTRTFPDGVSFGSDGKPMPGTTVIGPFLEIPYGFLAIIVIGVPVLAALISALSVRRAPVVTRRSD